MNLSQTYVFKQFEKFAESSRANASGEYPHPILTFQREVQIFIHYDLLPAFKRLEDYIILEYRRVQSPNKATDTQTKESLLKAGLHFGDYRSKHFESQKNNFYV
jgi:hypothetical protein